MSNETRIHPLLTPKDIILRAEHKKMINDYHRTEFMERDRNERRGRIIQWVAWGMITSFVTFASAFSLFEYFHAR